MTHALANGHRVRSVVAADEPARQRRRALDDLSRSLPSPDEMARAGARIRSVSTSPDFHPGRPVPVGATVDAEGAVLPHLVGNDIGCGMRLIVLRGVSEEDVRGARDLEPHMRHLFFQGGRDVSLSGRQRAALLVEGLPGFVEALRLDRRGLLARVDLRQAEEDLDRTGDLGVFQTRGMDPDFAGFAGDLDAHRRDAILGTVGGGNHFVEVGVVDGIADPPFAAACGLRRGDVVTTVHSGSLDFGQRVGSRTRSALLGRSVPHDRRILGGTDPALLSRFLDGLAAAANAAYGNRMLLGLMAADALARSLEREVGQALVYDSAHNMAWVEDGRARHRKGSCPARGAEAMAGTPYAGLGEPVVLPGSMGDGTWLLRGLGNEDALASSAHGAGRRLSRGEARATAVLPSGLRVVGPVDLRHPSLRGRRGVVAEAEARLREEAPDAYRPIDDVVGPMETAGVASRAARIRPLLTVKG